MYRAQYVECFICGEVKKGGVQIDLKKPMEMPPGYAPSREVSLCDECIQKLKEV